MFLDKLTLVAGAINGATNALTGQTIAGTDANVLSTNVIDLGTKRDIGAGEDIYGHISITAAVVGGTSVIFQVLTADDAAMTTNLTLVASTATIPVASLKAGAQFVAEIMPRIGSIGQRYMSMRYTTIGAVTAGAYVGEIGIGVQDSKSYPSGFTQI